MTILGQGISLLKPEHFSDYELVDCGAFEKLERFGDIILARPEPQAVWAKALSPAEWKKMTASHYILQTAQSGVWKKVNAVIPDEWNIQYKGPKFSLKFRLSPGKSKHVGIFPEQASNWEYIFAQCQRIPKAKVLNLFAYTGGASLAALAGGANVVHCEAVKKTLTWAKQNADANGFSGVRFFMEDALKLVKREIRRGSRYHGIILDPPAYGHGPNGEMWKLEETIDELTADLVKILEPEQHFFILNVYSLGFSPLILGNLIRNHFGVGIFQKTELGELYLQDRSQRCLPLGIFARFVG